MDFEKAIGYVFNLIVFIVLSIIFVPAFFIVTYAQEYWSKKMADLFKL
ncbi:MAG TPA: hypothetical protein VLB02_01550 [Candidatus Paceibacterota bacterium]|nr:hypothetical protein [Candidatus Paceibacterota bacterium]